jgi:hypothetical protein
VILSDILAAAVVILFLAVVVLWVDRGALADQVQRLHKREQHLWEEFMRHTHSNHVPAVTDVSDESVQLHTDHVMWWMARPGK